MLTELPETLPRKINLGCGYDIRPGYLNVDFVERHNPDLVSDVTSLPMLPGGYFDEVVAQDVWEHFEREKTLPALMEWARLLSPEGVLHIRIPSTLHLVGMLLHAERQGADRVREILHLMYGTQAYTGDYHLTGFTPSILADLFASAGLTINAASLSHGWLYDISASRGGATLAAWPAFSIHDVWPPPPTPSPLQQEVNLLRNQAVRLQQQIEQLETSTSWRITASLRALKKLFG